MIQSVWIEIRPALKCCHFCIVFKEDIRSKVHLKLKKASLEINLKGNTLNINFKDFDVEPLTMLAFNSTKKTFSFRVQAECNFKFEKYSPSKSIFSDFGNEKVNFLCQCDNPLTQKILFERKLPLPSEDFNFSSMFCHLPNGVHEPNIEPKINDCFYSDNYLVINKNNLTDCIKNKKFIKCKRCLSTVATCNKDSVKFWVTCIKLPFNSVTMAYHFKHLIYNAISNPVTLFPKILLECEENETYLSLVIVDKNLVISTCLENLMLKNTEVVKIKYQFHAFCDSNVKKLKEDPFHSLHYLQVHEAFLKFSTKFLMSNSKSIPSIFRKMGDECMAYICLENLS